MGYNLYYYLDLLTVTAFAVTVKRLYITVAYGENQRSTCEAKVKSYKIFSNLSNIFSPSSNDECVKFIVFR